jgi:hypothetical protein
MPVQVRRFLIAAVVACSALMAGAPATYADGPTKIPLPQPNPQILTGSCTFAVLDEILTNGETGIFFATYFIVTGPLKVRLTNMVSATSLTLNISGPAKVYPHADGTTTVIGRGAGLIPSPGHLWYARGNSVVAVSADGTQILVSTDGTVVDLCGALA